MKPLSEHHPAGTAQGEERLWVRISKRDGTERPNFTAFYESLLQSKGVSLGTGHGSGTCKRGRGLSYHTKTQYPCEEAFGYNDNLLVGKAYTALLDLNPGDECEIKLGRKQIRLIPAGGAEEDE